MLNRNSLLTISVNRKTYTRNHVIRKYKKLWSSCMNRNLPNSPYCNNIQIELINCKWKLNRWRNSSIWSISKNVL